MSGGLPCNTVDLYLAPSELKCNTSLSGGLLQIGGQHQLLMSEVRANAGILVLRIRIEEGVITQWHDSLHVRWDFLRFLDATEDGKPVTLNA